MTTTVSRGYRITRRIPISQTPSPPKRSGRERGHGAVPRHGTDVTAGGWDTGGVYFHGITARHFAGDVPPGGDVHGDGEGDHPQNEGGKSVPYMMGSMTFRALMKLYP